MKYKKVDRFYFLIFLFITILFASSVHAATYYVDQNHPQASDSNSGTEAFPWLTLYNSTGKLYAGDVLIVKNGTYASKASQEWYIPGITFSRSGTSGNPITVKAYPGHTPVIDGNTSTWRTIGAYNKSYIVLDGFKIIYGVVAFHTCSYITIQNCELQYGLTDPADPSHTNMIIIESTQYATIRNNKIYGNKYHAPGGTNNQVAIMLYGNNNNTIIENNLLYDNHYGYRNKCGSNCPSNQYNTIRYNIFRDHTYNAILLGGYSTASQNERIYQNIFLNTPMAIFFNTGNSGAHVYNNVFYWDAGSNPSLREGVGIIGGSTNPNLQIFNNIFRGYSSPISNEVPLPSGLYIDYNSYSNYIGFFYDWSWITFNQFKTNVGNNNYVQNNVDPLFVDPTNRDFRLQSNSPCLNSGRDGVNMGAYITGNEIIGLISETRSDTIPPSTPTNLTANAISSSQINLSWTASTDNVGVTGYRIYRCQGSGCTPTTQVATSPTNSYQNTGLAASTTYRYCVQAYDAAGNLSSYSSTVSVTTQPQDTTPPASPTGFRIE